MAYNKRLFFICTRQFWPISSGKDVTLYHNCKALCEQYGYDIHLVCFSDKNTDKGLGKPDFISEVRYVDVPGIISTVFNILSKSLLFNRWPFQNSLFYSKRVMKSVTAYYQDVNPQVLIVDMVRLVPYGEKILKKFKVDKKILIEDDLLSKRYLRQLQTYGVSGLAGQYESNLPRSISKIINTKWIKEIILRAEIKRLEKYELKLPKLFDWITFISPIETFEIKTICFNETAERDGLSCRRCQTVHATVDGREIIRCGCISKIASQAISLTFSHELRRVMQEFDPDIVIFNFPKLLAVCHNLFRYMKK